MGENYSMDGCNSWVLIILFALIFGWGGNGFGSRQSDFGQYATAASQQEILFGQQFQGLDNKIDRIGNGIAAASYDLQGQLSNCCCENQKNVDSVRYDMANFASSIQQNDTANTQKILDALAQNKIDALQAQVSELKTQNMFCGIPRINPYGYGVYPYSNGCGCNAI